jgi:hypothetical protein
MVRIPATLVALVAALGLDAGAFVLARIPLLDQLPIALLPLWATAAGLVAGRWSARTPPVPGFAVGMLLVATQIGCASGAYPELRAFMLPQLLMLQVVGAIGGGMTGTLLARRAHQAQQPEPEYTSLT